MKHESAHDVSYSVREVDGRTVYVQSLETAIRDSVVEVDGVFRIVELVTRSIGKKNIHLYPLFSNKRAEGQETEIVTVPDIVTNFYN